MRRSDLREIAKFGWLEEGIGAAGTFFVSGAFWTLATLLIEHYGAWEEHWAGFGLCVICIIFGAVLLWIARSHFQMREDRINDYFEDKEDNASKSS